MIKTMARTKVRYRLKVQAFNPARPDKFGMKIAVPYRPKKVARKPRKNPNPEQLTFSAGHTHTFYKKNALFI